MNRTAEWIVTAILTIITCGLFLLLSAPSWVTHLSMCKDAERVKRLKKASYKELRNLIMSMEWEYDPHHPHSLFGIGDNDYKQYFHAGIFEINGTGYLMTPIGYWLISEFQRKYRKTLPSYTPHAKPYVR